MCYFFSTHAPKQLFIYSLPVSIVRKKRFTFSITAVIIARHRGTMLRCTVKEVVLQGDGTKRRTCPAHTSPHCLIRVFPLLIIIREGLKFTSDHMLPLQMVKLIAQRFAVGGKSTTGQGKPTSGAYLCKRSSVQTLSRLLSAQMVFAYLRRQANVIITVTNVQFLVSLLFTFIRRNKHPSNSTPPSVGSPAAYPHISQS